MTIPAKGDLIELQLNSQKIKLVVLSPKSFNESTLFSVVCPISNEKKGYPFEVELSNESEINGVILTDQVRTIEWKSRKIKTIGKVPDNVIDTCIKRIHTFISI